MSDIIVETDATRAVFEEGTAGNAEITDYRGTSVLSSWQPIILQEAIPGTGVDAVTWALIAEIDGSEALGSSDDLLLFILIIGVVISVGVFGIAYYLSGQIADPLLHATAVAERIAAGDLDQEVTITTRDEVGVLGRTLNQMTAELRDLFATMETRITARTQDLAATVDVGQLATSIYDQETLLPQLVEYIRDQFDLYYVQIYLLDEAKRYANLRAGSGEVGEQLLARSHRLDMSETSIVARTVQSGVPFLVVDTAASGNSEHGLCYVDVDRFRTTNDHCGHPAGDRLLIALAALLGEQIRRRDTLARMGGNAFAILMEHCSLSHIARVAEAIQQAVGAFRFECRNDSIGFAVTVGVVPIDSASRSVDGVLRAADRVCYAAKSAGGGRILVYGQPDHQASKERRRKNLPATTS